jgi:hypothetical protein
MAREKHKDKQSANEKPAATSAGKKSLNDAPEGGKKKAVSGKGRVDPMKKD